MMRSLLIAFCILVGAAASVIDKLDLVFVIDDSTRLADFRWPRNKELYNFITRVVKRVFNKVESPRVGLVTYNDKMKLPHMSLKKTSRNYCSLLKLRLGKSMAAFEEQLDDIRFKAQASEVELMTDAYGGLMKALDPTMKWRESTPEHPIKHVIMLLAGAEPRRPNNGFSCKNNTSDLRKNDGDFNYVCGDEDYYTEDQVLEAMTKEKITLYTFTWDGFFEPYLQLTTNLGGQGKVQMFLADPVEVVNEIIRVKDGEPQKSPPISPITPPEPDSEDDVDDENDTPHGSKPTLLTQVIQVFKPGTDREFTQNIVIESHCSE